MKREQKIAISIIALLALLIALRIAIISHVFDYNPPPPSAIDNIQSTSCINFDAIVDKDQNIHLIWKAQGKALTYKKSTDGGKTWSLYRRFDNPDTNSYTLPRILAVNSTLVMLWVGRNGLYRRLSLDGGVNWEDDKNVMAKIYYKPSHVSRQYEYVDMIDKMAKIPGQLKSILVSEGTIYLIYGEHHLRGLYCSKSDDYGDTWSEPKMLLSEREWSLCTRQVASVISGENIHIIYRQVTPDDPNGTGLFYIHSPDKGEHWVNKGRIYSDRITEGSSSATIKMVGYPQLAAAGDTLILTISDDDLLCFLNSNDNGNTWQPFNKLSDLRSSVYSLYSQNDVGIVLLWVDHRNMVRDWWGYIPFHSMLQFFNIGPYWANNDLYYALIKGGRIAKTERLTPQLSFIGLPITHDQAIPACLIKVKDKIMVFWAGKRRVEKDFTDQNIPYQIFYKPLKTD